jgi:hypothetical protein
MATRLPSLSACLMIHERWAKPELPRQEQSRTNGAPVLSGPSSRHTQQHGALSPSGRPASAAVRLLLVDVMVVEKNDKSELHDTIFMTPSYSTNGTETVTFISSLFQGFKSKNSRAKPSHDGVHVYFTVKNLL